MKVKYQCFEDEQKVFWFFPFWWAMLLLLSPLKYRCSNCLNQRQIFQRFVVVVVVGGGGGGVAVVLYS